MKNNMLNETVQGVRKNPKEIHQFFVEFAVKPNAPKNRIYEDYGGLLRLDITASPVKGKANKAIIKFLAKNLAISSAAIQIVQGHTSTTKIFAIHLKLDSAREVRQRLLI